MMKSLVLSTFVCAALALGVTAFAKDKAPAKSDAINKSCPIGGEAIDPAVTTEHDGKTVAFCCKACIKKFDKDPEKYLSELAAKGDDSTATKKKDGAAKKGAATKKEGTSELNKMCLVHPDNPVDQTVTTEHNGQKIGFCCEDCLKAFNADPDRYVKAEEKK